ncbi:MAG: hypothetical protein U1E60_14930 [Reyranellaceae bacterium]
MFSLGGFGTFDMQTVKGVFGGNGVGEIVFLASNPATGTRVTTVDLSAVAGPTQVWANGSTLSETITGSVGATDTLLGGFAADRITAKGTGQGPARTSSGVAAAPTPRRAWPAGSSTLSAPCS